MLPIHKTFRNHGLISVCLLNLHDVTIFLNILLTKLCLASLVGRVVVRIPAFDTGDRFWGGYLDFQSFVFLNLKYFFALVLALTGGAHPVNYSSETINSLPSD